MRTRLGALFGLVALMPAEKIVIEADLYDPPGTGEPLPAAASAANRSFYNHVRRLGLDVETIVPIHGRAVLWTDFLSVVGR